MVLLSLHPHNAGYWALRAGIVSLTFAAVVWALRAATPFASFFGGVICLLVTLGTESAARPREIHCALMPLMGLFLLTFFAGRLGRAKVRSALGESSAAALMTGSREQRRGRDAAQVIANLGFAGLVAGSGLYGLLETFASQRGIVGSGASLVRLATLGALAEATADTVSSELGAAFGGRPFLITTLRRVDPGTDGAISLFGTLAGTTAAAIVVAAGVWSMGLTLREALAALLGGIAGLLFDSLLGATAERRGWLENDWVNFLSTIAGGLIAWALASA